jgi:hypothetical protein
MERPRLAVQGKEDDMKTFLWFLIGVIGGFVAAHFMNKDPRGHDILAEVDARINGFTTVLSDAYRAQEARLVEPVVHDR